MNSATCLRCPSCYSLVTLLLTCSSFAQVNFHQTIPQDGLACPNGTLQFTCTSPGNGLILQVGSDMKEFKEQNSVNDTLTFGDFVAVLVVQNETTISATITNERVMSIDNGTLIVCAGDSSSDKITVTIAELSVVNKFDYVSECDPSLNLIVTFHWMEPSVLGACSISDMPLQYMYSIEFNNSQFTNNSTRNTSYRLMGVPQGTVLEITITPTLPSQELIGPPLFRTVTLVGIGCTTSSSSPSPTPLQSPSPTPLQSPSPTPLQSPGGANENNADIVASLIAVAVLLLVVLTAVFVGILIFCIWYCYKKERPQEKASASKPGKFASHPSYDAALVQETAAGDDTTVTTDSSLHVDYQHPVVPPQPDPPIAGPQGGSSLQEKVDNNGQVPTKNVSTSDMQNAVPSVGADQAEKIQHLEPCCEKYKRQVAEMKETIQNLQTQLGEKENELEQEKSSKVELTKTIDDLKMQANQAEGKLKEVQLMLKEKNEKIEELEDAIRQLKDRLKLERKDMNDKIEKLQEKDRARDEKDRERDNTEKTFKVEMEQMRSAIKEVQLMVTEQKPPLQSGTGTMGPAGAIASFSKPVETTCKEDQSPHGGDSAFESGARTDLERDHGQYESRHPPPYGSSSGLAPSEEDTNPPNNGGDAVLLLPSRSPLPINHREQAGNGAETNRFNYGYMRDEMVGHLSSNTNRSPTRHVTTSSTYRKL